MGRAHVVPMVKSRVSSSTDQSASTKVLAIGDVEEWRDRGHPLPDSSDLSFMAFHEVSEASLELHSPSVIYSPVLARNFDCIELAILLETLGFQGIYRAVANDLPNPSLIEREVRQLCRRLTFELIHDT